MPILPENRCLYPDDWPDVRERILLRAGNRCEQCDKPNIESVITRSNGLWLDTRFGCWRDEYGKRLSIEENAATRLSEAW